MLHQTEAKHYQDAESSKHIHTSVKYGSNCNYQKKKKKMQSIKQFKLNI